MKALAAIDYEGDFTYETHRYTQAVPDEVIFAALRYSYELGQYLLSLAKADADKTNAGETAVQEE